MLEPGNRNPQHHIGAETTYSFEDTSSQVAVDRLVPIYNYNNPNARAIAHNIGVTALQNGIETAEIHTVAGGAEPNAEVLYDNRAILGPRALAVHIGGDGTLHTVTNGLRIASQYAPQIYQTKRLFHEGGTACDTSKALNDRRKLSSITSILESGWLVDVYPLELQVDVPSDSETTDVPQLVHALSYMSLGGFTGLAAEYINSPEHRNRWLNKYRPTKRLAQGLTGVRAFRDARTIEMTVDPEPRHTTLDIHCLSGPIMATLKHRSKELTEPGFHVIENEKLSLPYLLSRALRLGMGKLIEKEAEARLNVAMTTHDATILQADGETWRVPAGTTVSIKPGDPFQAVTTRPELRYLED